jgi:hypothetical protein
VIAKKHQGHQGDLHGPPRLLRPRASRGSSPSTPPGSTDRNRAQGPMSAAPSSYYLRSKIGKSREGQGQKFVPGSTQAAAPVAAPARGAGQGLSQATPYAVEGIQLRWTSFRRLMNSSPTSEQVGRGVFF